MSRSWVRQLAINSGINLDSGNAAGENDMFGSLLKGKKQRNSVSKAPKKVSMSPMGEEVAVAGYGDERRRFTSGKKIAFATLSFFVTGTISWALCLEIDSRAAGVPAFAVQAFSATMGSIIFVFKLIKDDESNSPKGITWGKPTHRQPRVLVMWPIHALDVLQYMCLTWGMYLMSDYADLIPSVHALLPLGCVFWVVGAYQDQTNYTTALKAAVIVLSLPLEKATALQFSELRVGPIVGVVCILLSCVANGLNFAFIEKELIPRHTPRSCIISMWVCGLFYTSFMLLSPFTVFFPTMAFPTIRGRPIGPESHFLYIGLFIFSALQQIAFFFALNGERNATFNMGVNKTAVVVVGTAVWNLYRGACTLTNLPLSFYRILIPCVVFAVYSWTRPGFESRLRVRKSNIWRGRKAPAERPKKYFKWLQKKHRIAKKKGFSEDRAPSPVRGPSPQVSEKKLAKLKMRTPSTGSILKLPRDNPMFLGLRSTSAVSENVRSKLSPDVVKRLIAIKTRVKAVVARRKAKRS